jgi:aspartate kinase
MGERLACEMMASHIGAAEAVHADEIIVTCGTPGDSYPRKVSEPIVRSRIEPLLADGTIPIVTGFFGRGPNGLVTTFGRGGSDLTATFIGSCLDASDIQLYKVEQEDGQWVDGFVGVIDQESRETVDYMTMQEATNLAESERQVLHPRAMKPIEDKATTLHIKNTLNPELPGTRITNQT